MSGASAHVQYGTGCQKSHCKKKASHLKKQLGRKHAFEREAESVNIRVPSVKKKPRFRDNMRL